MVGRLRATPVSEGQWGRFLDTYVSRQDAAGVPLKGRAQALADRKRDALQQLYRRDPRVAPLDRHRPWGLPATNTHPHLLSPVRGTGRPERNMLGTVRGDFAKLDRTTLDTLARVLA